ncbi:DUF7009 family protein [Reichenbachiella ulvae]|uniref:Uncharacterized protein n=1 Tax=Reichenbachiella ulvae TaxID=2980104 RepID=A0ABT3CTQ5_9BACT|nr:hypothetical protein [Reichenbachiella ulvae]MCV9386933.1 hypothetical protein [Reichenbachiella ulvae]
MKLRILNNSIRLRVSQSEVDQFEQTGKVSGRTDFGNQSLVYTLAIKEGISKIDSSFENNEIIIFVPTSEAKAWLNPENVGFRNEEGSDLKILVEKDFQCLHKRPDEDESDSFPNPQAIQN